MYWVVSGSLNGKLFAKAFDDKDKADAYLRRRFEAGAFVYMDMHGTGP